MLRQALLRLTTQALLCRNLLLHSGDPSIEPEKIRERARYSEIVWLESGDAGFFSGPIHHWSHMEPCWQVLQLLFTILYTKHHQTSPDITRHHQRSPKIKQPSNIIKPKQMFWNNGFLTLNLPGSDDVWPDCRLSSAQVRSSHRQMRRSQTYHRATTEMDGIEYQGDFQHIGMWVIEVIMTSIHEQVSLYQLVPCKAFFCCSDQHGSIG